MIVIFSQAFNVALCVCIAFFLTQQRQLALYPAYTILPVVAAGFGLYAMYGQLRWRKINRRMRNLQLAVTRQGVTYASAAGTYSAPWSSVQRIRLQERRMSVAYLILDVADWGGPVGKAGRIGRLAIPIHDCGIDELHIKRAIHHLSGGAIMATRN